MNNFNLLISTSRYNEDNAKAEIWFTLLICGDPYSIISSLDFQGLISATTTLNHKNVISDIKQIISKDPDFFQYILKIIPIDFVCQTRENIIKSIVQNHYREFINTQDSFKIVLKRRKNELIDRDPFIKNIAKIIDNEVNLTNPNIIIRIEILRQFTGISFLQQNEIIRTGIGTKV